MKHFDAAATARALAWPALIGALERLFVEGCEVPARQVHAVGDALTSLVMPAWQAGRFYGVKVVNVAAGNAARGLHPERRGARPRRSRSSCRRR